MCSQVVAGQLPMAPNNEGGLDLTATGGYGDFTDSFDSEVNTFRLCHKHSHRFANWLNNPEVLHMYYGHSHAGTSVVLVWSHWLGTAYLVILCKFIFS